MATYTVSAFTIDERVPARFGSAPFGFASGTVTINPYSQVHLAITKITGLFKTGGLLRVIVGPADAAGAYLVVWDNVNNSIKAVTGLSTGGFTEAAEGLTTLGAINWMAVGQLG